MDRSEEENLEEKPEEDKEEDKEEDREEEEKDKTPEDKYASKEHSHPEYVRTDQIDDEIRRVIGTPEQIAEKAAEIVESKENNKEGLEEDKSKEINVDEELPPVTEPKRIRKHGRYRMVRENG